MVNLFNSCILRTIIGEGGTIEFKEICRDIAGKPDQCFKRKIVLISTCILVRIRRVI